MSGSLKRKCYDLSQTKNFKRFRRNVPSTVCHILNLSDCVLMKILERLDTTALFQLSKTCTRFHRLALDESLWIEVEARHKPNSTEKSDFCWQHINKKTKKIMLAGNKRSNVVISVDKLMANPCLQNLTVLALENQCIKYCWLVNFPETLEELSFRYSYIYNHADFFRFSHNSMKNLKTLILDHCKWLTSSSFLSICKYPKLEILSVYMCTKLGEDDITTLSLAGHSGFYSIKVFDLRFTDIGETIIRTCFKKPHLQIIYVQAYKTTYCKEYELRLKDISDGKKIREIVYEKDDRRETSRESLEHKFHCSTNKKPDIGHLDDNVVKVLELLKPSDTNESRPKSFLYKYPYEEECSCDYSKENSILFDIKRKDSDVGSTKPVEVYQISPDDCLDDMNFEFNSCFLPDWSFTQATPENGEQKWIFVREPHNEYEIEFLENTEKNFRTRLALKYFERTLSQKSNAGCYHDNHVILFAEHGAFFPMKGTHFKDCPANIRSPSDQEVTFLIMRMAELLEFMKSTKKFRVGAETVVSTIITSIDFIRDKEEYLEDVDFVDTICQHVSALCELVNQRFIYVLNFHFACVKRLIHSLRRTAEMTDENKKILVTFFRNLLNSESPANEDYSEDVEFDRERTMPSTTSDGGLYQDELLSSKQDIDFIASTSDSQNNHNLTIIRLNNNGLQQIVQDLGMSSNRCSYLKELSLRGYRNITDSSLGFLKNVGLDLLDVTDTAVTLTGLRNFRSANPNCRLIHKYACVCRPSMHF